jgi:hypothetical protein
MKENRYQRTRLFSCIYVLYFMLFTTSVQSAIKILAGWTPSKSRLIVTDNLDKAEKEIIVETDEWKIVFSLFYNGGIYQMYDKVHDPDMLDNLVTDPSGYEYCQGGIFDYDVYLRGEQEFMTTMGRNNNIGRASLEILENTPVRVRIRQICHPRLNNGGGPPGDHYIELDMVHATSDWTFYPTGRVNIKFDAIIPEDWNEILSTGSGEEGPGINAFNDTIIALNGTDFLNPWITCGDMIESATGGWGPVEIAERINQSTLRLTTAVPSGSNLDFIIRRTNIIDETISIHADGDPAPPPHTSYWQGGSNGVPIWSNGTDGDMFRGNTPPLSVDYVFAHWTRAPRSFGNLLAFNESLAGWTYAVFNDLSWADLSYTQVARRGWRRFQEHHRYFMAHLGTEDAQVLPRIKSAADAIPFADDYRNPYAEARVGTLSTGDGISGYGFHVATGAYHISAENNRAEMAFDARRNSASPIAYAQPAILVSSLGASDDQLHIELSQDNGIQFEELPPSWYNLTTSAESEELGDANRRLLQLFCSIPATATGDSAWILRVYSNTTGINEKAERIPNNIQLRQNYPNPFNPSTIITYQLSTFSTVRLMIYDMLGRQIKKLVDSHQNAGGHSVAWNATDERSIPVSPGVYFCRLETGKECVHRKMVVVR